MERRTSRDGLVGEDGCQYLRDASFGGERALFALREASLDGVRFLPGESPLKHSADLTASRCEFLGKYPLWHSERVVVSDSWFTTYARAAIWYTSDVTLRRCRVDAPKMFRRASGVRLEDTTFSNAAETLWNCRQITLRDVSFTGADYLLMNGEDIDIDGMELQGNYAFQTARNVVIRNARIDSRDALWEAEDVTVHDSVLDGEFLGWHSRNLRLVNCVIRGPQPLCYCTDLVLENCRIEGGDLAFEYSTVDADVTTPIESVRNPDGGSIRAPSIGRILLDEHGRGTSTAIVCTGGEAR